MVELIAHRAGNSRSAAEAFGPIADSIEIDVHLYRGQVVVRHAKRLWFTKRLWERWYLLPRGATAPLVGEALQWLGPTTGLWVDCKGIHGRLADEVLGAIGDHGPITVSSKSWWTVRRAAAVPKVRALRSVGNRFELLLLRVIPPGRKVDGVVVHSRLLNEELVAKLHRQNHVVFSWSIPTADLAHALIDLGIDGLIIDSLPLLTDLRLQADEADPHGDEGDSAH